MSGILHRLRARFRNRGFDDELAEELRFHEETKREELEAAGMPAGEARTAARRALGNVTLMREESRRIWIAPWLEGVVQDARYALRALRRQPLHSLTAILVLVLGIGLSSALFTCFKAVALHPWPVPDADAVVRVGASTAGRGVSVDEYRFLGEHVRSFAGLAAFSANYPARLRADGLSEVSLRATWVSANFFETLRIPMALGSGFIASDDTDRGARAPLVLGHVAWRTYFAGNPNVVGRAVFIAGRPFTIAGVAPAAFDGNGQAVDLWMPLSVFALVRPSADLAWDASPASANCCIGVVGRLAPGADRRPAARELQLLHERFASSAGRAAGRIELAGTAPIAAGVQPFALLGAFAAAAALVLVLACANVGNLQLGRGLARRQEIATRLSIGASRARLVRQMLTEGMVLALAAGAGAVTVAAILPQAVFRWAGADGPVESYIFARLTADTRVLLFILAVSVTACLAFALAPALHATRLSIPLGTFDRLSTPGRPRLRSSLLAIQIAACTVLLVGAGLLTRAVAHAMDYDLGYAIEGVDMVSLAFPSETPTDARTAVARGALEAATAAGGAPVALTQFAPPNATPLVMAMALPHRSPSEYTSVALRTVSSAFFDVLGIPMVRGRMFGPDATSDAVVNEAFARTYWAGEEILGRTVRDVDRKGGVRQTFTIVGVVKNAYLTGLERIDPVIFTPVRWEWGVLLTRGGPETVERIRATAVSLDPSVAATAAPLRESLRQLLAPSRGGATVAWTLGLLGLALAAVGVFGVFAYSVEERRREIGVRLALGARESQIVRTLVATSGRAMGVGLGLGLLLSFACGPVLRSYLFGLRPLDPMAYAGVIALLGVTATLATLVPARRACRVDPAVTLRDQ
jgi:predicted permease